MPNLSCDGCNKGLDGDFYQIDHFAKVYVIEFAETEEEARSNAFGDAYDFPDECGDEEIIRQVRETMIKICNGEM